MSKNVTGIYINEKDLGYVNYLIYMALKRINKPAILININNAFNLPRLNLWQKLSSFFQIKILKRKYSVVKYYRFKVINCNSKETLSLILEKNHKIDLLVPFGAECEEFFETIFQKINEYFITVSDSKNGREILDEKLENLNLVKTQINPSLHIKGILTCTNAKSEKSDHFNDIPFIFDTKPSIYIYNKFFYKQDTSVKNILDIFILSLAGEIIQKNHE
jgi:hypothetical protein